jgi:hypothetical protein
MVHFPVCANLKDRREKFATGTSNMTVISYLLIIKQES